MGASPFLPMKEDREQKWRTVILDKSNAMGDKINKLASMLGKLST